MKWSWVAAGLCMFIGKVPGVNAQYYYLNDKYYNTAVILEVGASVGIMNSLNDLGGKKGRGKGFIKDLNWKMTKPSFSVYGLAMYKDAIGLRIEGTFGSIHNYDTILKKVAATTSRRYDRNLSFRSTIRDIQLGIELHPLFFKNYSEDQAPYWSPYIVAGLGFFSFNPEASLDGTWYALQPLRTEGQGFAEYPDRKPYKLNQVNIPLGIGIKYELNSFLSARLEIVHRFLFTDYLDDVSTDYIDPSVFSNYMPAQQAVIATRLYNRLAELNPGYDPGLNTQRGNPHNKDSFFTIQLKLGIAIRTSRVN